jgi:hypothetical protein
MSRGLILSKSEYNGFVSLIQGERESDPKTHLGSVPLAGDTVGPLTLRALSGLQWPALECSEADS